MDNIFGTDGVRDRAGEGLLDAKSLEALGYALAQFATHGRRAAPRVLFGRDTRVSGGEIEARLGQALAAQGCEAISAGIVPTPAVSLLVPELGYDLGIVISASHNPPAYNGVKVFDRWGRKLMTDAEQRITRDYRRALGKITTEPPLQPGREPSLDLSLRETYLDLLSRRFSGSPLQGLTVVLDCARGATATVAREAFERAGATVHVIHDELDGERINHGCGSLHPQDLQRRVREIGADLGFAFDGDGDRVIPIDDQGAEVDGDDVLALWALSLKERGGLPYQRIVATVMSNAGMERYLSERSVQVLRAPVGDREVFRMLQTEGAVLGGEQSGHIIFSKESASGDGIRTGLHLARIVRESGQRLSELRAPIPRFPQVLLAVEVDEKVPFEELPEVESQCRLAQEALGDGGRVFLRYSGTESVARVLVEGEDQAQNQHWADRIRQSLLEEIRA